MKIMIIIILALACIIIGIQAIKWHISAMAAFHLMLSKGIDPSREEIRRSVRCVVEKLLRVDRHAH